jgi:hypothetical protein
MQNSKLEPKGRQTALAATTYNVTGSLPTASTMEVGKNWVMVRVEVVFHNELCDGLLSGIYSNRKCFFR